MNNKTYISLKNADLGYVGSGINVSVLKNINLDFYSGEMIGIVGANGVGKSTLLRTLSGLLPLISGQLYIDGAPASEYSLPEIAKKISIVLTDKFGGFNLTVFDVVAAGQIPYTDSFHRLTEDNLHVIEEAMSRCGITEYKNKPVNELSDGLFQKTVIAKALAQNTPVMLLDEPTAFLDYASKHLLFLLLQQLALKESKCILISSHDLDLLLKYCSRLVIVSAEQVELVTIDEALGNKRFLEIGGGFL